MVNITLKLISQVNAVFCIEFSNSKTELDLTQKNFSLVKLEVPENGTLCIYNKYEVSEIASTCLLKKVAGYFVLWLIRAFSPIDSWDIPFVVKTTATLHFTGNTELNIRFKQSDSEQPPIYHIESDQCRVIQNSSSCYIDCAELDKEYTQRKKALNVFGLIPTVTVAVCSGLSFLFANYITGIFTFIITLLFLSAFLFSRHTMKLKWQHYRSLCSSSYYND